MSVSVEVPTNFPLTIIEIDSLWNATRVLREYPDDSIGIRCLDEAEMQTLNAQYRKKNSSTNVLTFSYDGEHDIALCFPVIEREAQQREVDVRDYTALIMVHGFLHATGMDHEQSDEEEQKMRKAEQDILAGCGFSRISLQ